MNVLHLKDATVKLDPIAPAGGAILAALALAATTIKRDLTVTCGAEGHPPTDPHSRGEAYDARVAGLPEATIYALISSLKATLGPRFTVLYETPTKPMGILASMAYVNPHASAPHLHIQLGINQTFPTETTT